MKKIVIIGLVVGAIIVSLGFPQKAIATPTGEQIFQTNCAGCHPGGGNIIRRGKNLRLRALNRNQMYSQAAIEEIVTYGKNNMTAFEDRLSQDEIATVAAYVLQQAENGWK